MWEFRLRKKGGRVLKRKKNNCLAPKINKANSSETREKPSCGRDEKDSGSIESRVPETQSSILPSETRSGQDPWREWPWVHHLGTLVHSDLPGTPLSLVGSRSGHWSSRRDVHRLMALCVYPGVALCGTNLCGERQGLQWGLGLVPLSPVECLHEMGISRNMGDTSWTSELTLVIMLKLSYKSVLLSVLWWNVDEKSPGDNVSHFHNHLF